MKTRAQRRNIAQEEHREDDGDTPKTDSLLRPSIKSSRTSKVVDSEAGDGSKETKTFPKQNKILNESVTREEKHSYRSRLETSQARDNSYSDSDESDHESDVNEEHSSKDKEEMVVTRPRRRAKVLDSESGSDSKETKPLPKYNKSLNESVTRNESRGYRIRSDAFLGKLADRSIQDEKKYQMSRSTTPHVVKNVVNANKKDSSLFSDDEPEEQPRLHPRKEPGRSSTQCICAVVILLLLGALGFSSCYLYLKKSSLEKAEDKSQVLNSFSDGFRKLHNLFPSQSPHLWHRSQRILQVHLNHTGENKGPAIILLTAGQNAKEVLYCVGNQMAKAYASSRKSSFTVLSEMDKVSKSSQEVKLYIDKRLSEGFQTNKAAVLHQIELLPPESLLILYKYCDHENAAFQDVALVLTVLLNKATLTPDIELGELEEAVYDFLRETFVSPGTKTSHSDMDGDKLSGVWSRIAHVVLPVLPEKNIAKECEESKAEPALQEEEPTPKR